MKKDILLKDFDSFKLTNYKSHSIIGGVDTSSRCDYVDGMGATSYDLDPDDDIGGSYDDHPPSQNG